MMMRAGKKIRVHIQKQTTREAFRESREKNKNECVIREESQKLTSLLLYLNARTCAPSKIRTFYETVGKIHRKLKCDLSEMNDYLWSREMLRC